MPSQLRPSAPIRSANRKWLLVGWVVIAILLVQRPLYAPNMWWHLARGREVVSGAIAPSRALLTRDVANDSDWLSGVPWYLAWTAGGAATLAAVPLVSALALLLLIPQRLRAEPQSLAALPIFLVCIRDGLQPDPEWFDVLGMIAVWRVFAAEMTVRHRRLAVLLTFIAWGNFGPRPLWGLLLLLLQQGRQPTIAPADRAASGHGKRENARAGFYSDGLHGFALFLIALLGGMITPRGIWTWRDSVVVFAPSAFEDLAVFGETIWQGSFSRDRWDGTEWAFLLLWCGWIFQHTMNESGALFRRDRPGHPAEDDSRLSTRSVMAFGVPLLAALLCRKNLPVCGLWIALDMLERNLRHTPIAPVAAQTWRTVATAVVVCVVVALDAWGLGPGPCRRLGWGVAQELNPELLDRRLLSAPNEKIVGWAPDGRSVGIVVWLNGGVIMADHPERALLGGRGAHHAALIQDFIGSHRAGYRRDDGAWGGWVRQLDEWKVRLLLIPAEQLPLNRAVLTTTWKPVDLDSPSVPFVSAHDPHFSAVVLESLQQRAFVEAGPWQPTVEIYSGGNWRFDFVEWIGGGPDPAPAIRQSQLFRSLEIPIASLRALLPVRQQTQHRQLTKEFRSCQRDLAYQEWMTFGEVSDWRREVVNSWGEDSTSDNDQPWLKPNTNAAVDETWKPAIEAYRKGNLAAAIQALPRQSPQQRYTVGMLWLELGDSGKALAEFRSLLDAESEPGVQVAAKYWVEQLKPFVERP